jgi:ubiquinone/menaquinone biosynthesis C-methylase UbiE
MTDQSERFDAIAQGYERWWAPVLAPSAAGLIERLDERIAAGARDLIDVGIGTGNLTFRALARWPEVRVTGIDASREMTVAVDRLAADRLPTADDRARLDLRVAFAAELPFEDGRFDLAMSSFVLQLVPNRAKVLREIRRVLRPGGSIGHVTWLADRSAFAPDRIFDALLDEYGFEDAAGDDRHGDIPSVANAASELRHAGFRDVSAEGAELVHPFTVPSYIAFLTEFDETTLFEDMTRSERRRFLAELRQRLMALPEEGLWFRAPIVYATGHRGP